MNSLHIIENIITNIETFCYHSLFILALFSILVCVLFCIFICINLIISFILSPIKNYCKYTNYQRHVTENNSYTNYIVTYTSCLPNGKHNESSKLKTCICGSEKDMIETSLVFLKGEKFMSNCSKEMREHIEFMMDMNITNIYEFSEWLSIWNITICEYCDRYKCFNKGGMTPKLVVHRVDMNGQISKIDFNSYTIS